MITGIREMVLVDIISEDDEFYYCNEFGCYPKNMIALAKRNVKTNKEDYIFQKGNKQILMKASKQVGE
jgi:hypothetical protein